MSPIRRGHDKKTRRAVEAFLEETYPGADPKTKLHAMVCWRYHAIVFGGRGTRASVARKAQARGVTHVKLRQIFAGDLTGIRWSALEGVLAACGAEQADLEVALDLFDQVRQATAQTGPTSGADPRAPEPGMQQASPWSWPPNPPTPPHEPPKGPPHELLEELLEELPDYANDPGNDAEDAPEQTPHEQSGRTVAAPDPQTATDPGQFISLIKAFRAYKDTTLREMAKTCRNRPGVHPYSYAAFSSIGKSGKLPKRDLVHAYIAGCGGSDTEIDQWLQAHTRLAVQQATPPPADP